MSNSHDLQPIAADTDWRAQLRDAISGTRALLAELGLDAAQAHASGGACEDFPLRVPRAFVARMTPGDPRDPLLLQVLGRAQELEPYSGFGADPVGERGAANPLPGVMHKYRGRALLIASGACAVHCRYCFRRHFPYADNRRSGGDWDEALDYVRRDASIAEVILSGGDPLMLSDARLADLCARIAGIPHVKRLRIHTRLPVVIPARVTPGLLEAIHAPPLHTVVVLHSNHAREVDAAVRRAVGALRERGFPVLNQAVLLAGVNDSIATQAALWETLFEAGVLPYYLHLLDRVAGAGHFEVPEARARILHEELRARLPGYLVPRLVREVAGEPYKVDAARRP